MCIHVYNIIIQSLRGDGPRIRKIVYRVVICYRSEDDASVLRRFLHVRYELLKTTDLLCTSRERLASFVLLYSYLQLIQRQLKDYNLPFPTKLKKINL